MHYGPFPNALTLNAVSEIRAQYLAGDLLPLADVKQDFRDLNNQLAVAQITMTKSFCGSSTIFWISCNFFKFSTGSNKPCQYLQH